ncbi:hypothetical protein ACFL7M_05955 [Thermodesulfobacteriota bacterium]
MTADQRYKEILETLEKRYPGQIFISVSQLAKAADMAPGTVYNGISRRSKKRLNIPVSRIGNKPKFRVHDVARFMAGL